MEDKKALLIAAATVYLLIFFRNAYKMRKLRPSDIVKLKPRIGLDPYDVLEIPKQASIDEIQKAYQEKVKFFEDPKNQPSPSKLWAAVAKRKKIETEMAYKQIMKDGPRGLGL